MFKRLRLIRKVPWCSYPVILLECSMCEDEGRDNLATLPEITSQTIISTLTARYFSQKIYTRIGDILIALNPFEEVYLYSEAIISQYATESDTYSLVPHIFSISQQSFNNLKLKGQNQCCVISGESGSGKTETAKLLMRFLSHSCQTLVPHLPEQCHQMNPLIEAFGNAKTVMNGNSSRFGKYIELQFTPVGELVGAKITEYLLEKSRVISHAEGEQNFHIFYYLYAGLTPEYLNKLNLEISSSHRYLAANSVDSVILNDANNQKLWRDKFQEIVRCFNTLGFSRELLFQMLSVLIMILYIGDIEFEADEEEYAFVANSCILIKVAGILGISTRKLEYVFTSIVSTVQGGDVICKKCSVEKASALRDAAAKAIYSRLFSWIITQINASIGKDQWSGKVISILDIFGFENFKVNYFEQLCINTANEQLQFYFNQHIFAWEVDEYKAEGIPLENIEFVNNKHICDLLLKRPGGIFALLDEESVFPKANDQTFLEKIKNNCKNCDGILKYPRAKNLNFTISHFAGNVEYTCRDILEKNRDTLSDNIVQLFGVCEHYLVRELFTKVSLTRITNLQLKSKYLNCPKLSHSLKRTWGRSTNRTLSARRPFQKKTSRVGGSVSVGNAPPTVGFMFRNSLCDLMEKMLSCEPHFIRCIKPNQRNFPREVEQEFVERQLRSTGVLETVRIRQTGYSYRPDFASFLRTYGHLVFPYTSNHTASRANCCTVLRKLGLDNWVVGETKVFLKYFHSAQLDRLREQELKWIVTAQRAVRRYIARQRANRMKVSAAKEENSVVEFCSQVEMGCNRMLGEINRICTRDDQAFISLAFQSISKLVTRAESPDVNLTPEPTTPTIECPPFSFPPPPTQSEDTESVMSSNQYAPSTLLDPISLEESETRFSEYFELDNLPMKLRTRHSFDPSFTPVINKKRLSRTSASRSPSDTDILSPLKPKRSKSETYYMDTKSNKPRGTKLHVEPTPQAYTSRTGENINWLRIFCTVETAKIEFLISRATIAINGSKNTFDPSSISLRSLLTPDTNKTVSKLVNSVGRGIELFRDKTGDVYCKRMCKVPIHIRDFEGKSYYSKKLSALRGSLPLNELVKLLDYKQCCNYVDNLRASGAMKFAPLESTWGIRLEFQVHEDVAMIPSVEIHFLEAIDYYNTVYLKQPLQRIGSFLPSESIADEEEFPICEDTKSRAEESPWVDIYRTYHRKHQKSQRRRNVIASSVFMSENADNEEIASQINHVRVTKEEENQDLELTPVHVIRRTDVPKRSALSENVDQLLASRDIEDLNNPQESSKVRPKSTELEFITPKTQKHLPEVEEQTDDNQPTQTITNQHKQRKDTPPQSGKVTYSSIRRRNRAIERDRIDEMFDPNSPMNHSREEDRPIYLAAPPTVQQRYSQFHGHNMSPAQLRSAMIIQMHEAVVQKSNELSRMRGMIFISGLPSQKADPNSDNTGLLTRKKWHKPMTRDVVENRPILSRATTKNKIK